MKGITEAVVEEVKLRTDLVDLIASYGIEVKSAGSSKKACCPFHHEKTPSFNINERKGFYHCFGCGESGDAIKFVQKMDGCSFVDAVRKLAEPLGIKIEEKEDPEAGKRKRLYALMSEVANFYHRCLLQTKEAEGARAYLERRGLAGAVADDWLIGYAPLGCAVMLKWAEKYHYTPEELEAAGIIKAPNGVGDRGYHRFSGRLMFSIRDRQGRVVAFSGRQLVADKRSGKYVNSPETLIFKKSNVLFGFDRAAPAMARPPKFEGLVCEGQIDTIKLHLAGFTNAVASQGTAFTEEHARMLKRAANSMLLCYDDDAAGHKATIKVARLLLQLEMPVRTVTLPGGDDPDSFITKYGAEKFRELTEKAESIIAYQVRAESALEANPRSIDAVSRISKAVLQTIACSTSAVLKAKMVDEAARLMGLPVAALAEELAKTRVEKPVELMGEDEVECADLISATDSVPANEVSPPVVREHRLAPCALELDFLAFLLDHEYDAEIATAIGEYLPEQVFFHDFTRQFVAVWREQSAAGEDRIASFVDALDEDARAWFDQVLLAQGKSLESGLSSSDILHEFVRNLWRAELERRRGNLAADASGDADRLRISMELKRLKTLRWALVKEFIRSNYG